MTLWRGGGAQVCAPGGQYMFRESPAVETFVAAPHELALRMRLNEGAAGGELFEVADGGARHRGRLISNNVGTNVNDPAVWPAEKCARWGLAYFPATNTHLERFFPS